MCLWGWCKHTYNIFMGGRGGEFGCSGSLTAWSSVGMFDAPWSLLLWAASSSFTEASIGWAGSV